MNDPWDSIPCGLLSFGDDGRILNANAMFLNLLGYTLSEMKGGHIDAILSGGARIFYQTHFFPLLKLHGKVEEVYLSLKARSGAEVPVLVNACRRAQGESHTNDCALIPLHVRDQLQNEILLSSRLHEMEYLRYKSLFEQLTFGIVMIDGQGGIRDANPAAASVLGVLHRHPLDAWDEFCLVAKINGRSVEGSKFWKVKSLLDDPSVKHLEIVLLSSPNPHQTLQLRKKTLLTKERSVLGTALLILKRETGTAAKADEAQATRH
jgi:PAS domain S-box-containing protein